MHAIPSYWLSCIPHGLICHVNVGKQGLSLFHLARTLYQHHTLMGCLPCFAVKAVVVPHLKRMMGVSELLRSIQLRHKAFGLVIITGYNACFSLWLALAKVFMICVNYNRFILACQVIFNEKLI